jgi:hypothetical protein
MDLFCTAGRKELRTQVTINWKAGLQDFSLYKIPKREKYTKLPRTLPNVHKIYQHLKLQDPPKFTQFWIFGLKTNHLATLLRRRFWPDSA